MQDKTVNTLELGLVRLDNKVKQPKGSYSYALNTVPSDILVDRSTRVNEKGFDQFTTIKSVPYNIVGSRWLGTDSYVLFIKNKGGSVFNEIWVYENGANRLVYSNPQLNFKDNHIITAEYRVNYNGERIVYFVDGLNDDRVINIDTDVPIATIGQLSINSYFSSAKMSAIVNNSGGNLYTGQYFLAISYNSLDGYETPVFSNSNAISIVRDNYMNADSNSYLVNGDPAGTPTSKSISLTITELDQGYSSINLYVIRSSNTEDTIFTLKNIPIHGESLNRIITGGDLTEVTNIDLNDLTVPVVSYYASEVINQKENRLIRANTKIKADSINYQQFANNIKVRYVIKEEDMFSDIVTAGIRVEPDRNIITNTDGVINNSRKMGTYSTYLANTANCSRPVTTFMRDEVYSLGISLELTDGSETPVFHIPGRVPTSMDPGTYTGFGEFDRPYEKNTWDFGGTGFRWRDYNTALKGSNLLGYWRSSEVYPDGYGFPTDGEKDASGRSYVRHHKMPSDTLEALYTFSEDGNPETFDASGKSYAKYDLKRRNIALEVSNIVIPPEYANVVTRAKIHYTPRVMGNKSILSKGLLYNMATVDGQLKQSPSFNLYKDKDFTGATVDNRTFEFVSPEVTFNFKKQPIQGNKIKLCSIVKGYQTYQGIFAFGSNRYLINVASNITDENDDYIQPRIEQLSGQCLYMKSERPLEKDYNREVSTSMFIDSNFVGISEGLDLNLSGSGNTSLIKLNEDFDLKESDYPFIAPGGKFSNTYRSVNITGKINRSTANFPAEATQDDLYWDAVPYVSVVNNEPSLYGSVLDLTYVTMQADVKINGSGTYSLNCNHGDTFIEMHHVQKSFKQHIHSGYTYGIGAIRTSDGQSSVVAAGGVRANSFISYIGESDLNIRLRSVGTNQDQTYYPVSFSNATNKKDVDEIDIIPEYVKLEDFYNKKNIRLNFANNNVLSSFTDNSNRYENRIIYSDKQDSEDKTDRYRNVRANNYRDIPSNRGPISQSFVKQDSLFIVTRDSVFDVYASNKTIQTMDSDSITVGTGEFLSLEPAEIMSIEGGFGGTSSKLSLTESPYGYLFVDSIKNKTILFNDSAKDINIAGLNEDFTINLYKQFPELLDSIFDSPITGTGIISTYDPRLHRLIITKRDHYALPAISSRYKGLYKQGTSYTNGDIVAHEGVLKTVSGSNLNAVNYNDSNLFENKSFTVSYDPINDGWISYHSYIPDTYLPHINDFLMKSNNNIVKSNSNSYDPSMPFIIETVFNDNPLLTKVTDSIFTNTVSSGADGSFNNKFFDEVIVYNESQSSGIILLNKDTLTRKEKDWNINRLLDISVNSGSKKLFSESWNDIKSEFPIDKIINPSSIDNNKPWHLKGRFRDKYIVVRFKYNNKDNTKLSVNFLGSNYRISNR